MNQVIFLAMGILSGFLLATQIYKPDELKTNLASKTTALENTQTQLNECNQKMVGALMFK